MTRELTADKNDWFDIKNRIFKVGDILVVHERIVVEFHEGFLNEFVGKILAEPGDELVVVGADCIGCIVQNRTHPEMNFPVPKNCPTGEEHLYDCWICTKIRATLKREE